MKRIEDMVFTGPADGKPYRVPAYVNAMGHVVIDMPKRTIASHPTRDAVRRRLTQLEKQRDGIFEKIFGAEPEPDFQTEGLSDMRHHDDEAKFGNPTPERYDEYAGNRLPAQTSSNGTRNDSRARRGRDDDQPFAVLSPSEYSWEERDDGSLVIYKLAADTGQDGRRMPGRTDDSRRAPYAVLDVNGDAREQHPMLIDRLNAAHSEFWANQKAAS